LAARFRVRSTPFLLFLDGDGAEIDWIAGYAPPPEALRRKILRILSGRDTAKSLTDRLAKEPRSSEALIRLGMKYQERQNRPKALELFDVAAALDPKRTIFMTTDAGDRVSCREMAEFQRARSYVATWGSMQPQRLEAFVASHPNSPLARQAYLEVSRFSRLDDEEGRDLCREMMAKFPRDPEVFARVTEKIKESSLQGEQAATLDPATAMADRILRTQEEVSPAKAAEFLAFLEFAKNHPELAEDAYGPEFMVSQTKSWAESLLTYAEFWLSRGRNSEDADAAILKALSISPNETNIPRTAARLYLLAPARPEKALDVYGPRILSGLADNARALFDYFSFWKRNGLNKDSALAALDAALKLKPESVDFRISAASLFLDAGDEAGALAVFGPDFAAKAADSPSALFEYGGFWISKDVNRESAVSALIRAAKAGPRKWVDLWGAAQQLHKIGRMDAASEIFGDAILPQIAEDARALSIYAGFWISAKTNLDSALRALDTAARLKTIMPSERLYLIWPYKQLGRLDRAEALFGPEYLRTIPKDAEALIQFSEFWRNSNKNLNLALEAAQTACLVSKKDHHAWVALAEALIALGRWDEAMTAADTALKLARYKQDREECEAIRKRIE